MLLRACSRRDGMTRRCISYGAAGLKYWRQAQVGNGDDLSTGARPHPSPPAWRTTCLAKSAPGFHPSGSFRESFLDLRRRFRLLDQLRKCECGSRAALVPVYADGGTPSATVRIGVPATKRSVAVATLSPMPAREVQTESRALIFRMRLVARMRSDDSQSHNPRISCINYKISPISCVF